MKHTAPAVCRLLEDAQVAVSSTLEMWACGRDLGCSGKGYAVHTPNLKLEAHVLLLLHPHGCAHF